MVLEVPKAFINFICLEDIIFFEKGVFEKISIFKSVSNSIEKLLHGFLKKAATFFVNHISFLFSKSINTFQLLDIWEKFHMKKGSFTLRGRVHGSYRLKESAMPRYANCPRHTRLK